MDGILLQAMIYLTAAVIAVPLAVRLRLGSVLGYIAAGILIGPILGFVGSETLDLQHFAEFGVVMMLFLIGLELDPKTLWEMRHRLLGLGGLQIVLTMGAVMGAAMAFGLVWQTALAVGMILALSSTAIVLQTLNEKGLMTTKGGRNSFAVLLTQDIAVIPMLALIPLLALPKTARLGPDGSVQVHDKAHGAAHGLSLVEGLPAWGVTAATIAAVAVTILGGHFLTRPLFRLVHATHLREMFTAFALFLVTGIAMLMIAVGVSPALGTFLAGVVLANSEFRHELESSIEPFKGLLLGLFFMTVGAGINFKLLFADPVTLIALALGLMAVKGLILLALTFVFGLKRRSRWLFTLSLAQAGEFGFVLISFSLQTNVLTVALGQRLLLIIALSMLLTPLAFIINDFLSRRFKDTETTVEDDPIDETGPVIIAGIGRFGQVVNRMLQMSGIRATVLDHDLQMIETIRRFGFKGFFGDPTRPELLHAAGLSNARVLVVALDDKEAAIRLVKLARRERPDLHIVARAADRVHVYELYRAGANDIVREMFDSSLRAGRYVLENMGLSQFEAHEREVAFYKYDRYSLRELAALWKPGVSLTDNPEYLKRAQELNKEMETVVAADDDKFHPLLPPQDDDEVEPSDSAETTSQDDEPLVLEPQKKPAE
ncbi:monovalent cation:proton antiporter-2 (CPA2) family protein [Actibacterium pelagium]|uniref:Potassium transporter n=1 Tax=Actibacterium pelagium TaxID=2029103 RepID=A0A917AFK2_9RHOB|nr:monovalent cation:proton antiporter-2 (CPA2) family protein [Actibacterium pelagium]GGE46889.1 potassium transporter [Actibacterium pelagium]